MTARKRRGGFTLIEMMIALSISAFMVASILMMLSSVWLITKQCSDEMQCTLRSCALRNRLMHRLVKTDGTVCEFGLLNATNLVCCAKGMKTITATIDEMKKMDWSADMTDTTVRNKYQLDDSFVWPDRNAKPIQHVFLRIEEGKATYYERLVVPIAGRSPTIDEFIDAMGGAGVPWNLP